MQFPGQSKQYSSQCSQNNTGQCSQNNTGHVGLFLPAKGWLLVYQTSDCTLETSATLLHSRNNGQLRWFHSCIPLACNQLAIGGSDWELWMEVAILRHLIMSTYNLCILVDLYWICFISAMYLYFTVHKQICICCVLQLSRRAGGGKLEQEATCKGSTLDTMGNCPATP